VNTWTIITPLEILGRPKNGNTKPAADTNARTCITSHTLKI
jgi:hypothetical protein